MPYIARPVDEGGYGFDYRQSMGGPDEWVKVNKKFILLIIFDHDVSTQNYIHLCQNLYSTKFHLMFLLIHFICIFRILHR